MNRNHFRITDVEVIPPYSLLLTFADGKTYVAGLGECESGHSQYGK